MNADFWAGLYSAVYHVITALIWVSPGSDWYVWVTWHFFYFCFTEKSYLSPGESKVPVFMWHSHYYYFPHWVIIGAIPSLFSAVTSNKRSDEPSEDTSYFLFITWGHLHEFWISWGNVLLVDTSRGGRREVNKLISSAVFRGPHVALDPVLLITVWDWWLCWHILQDACLCFYINTLGQYGMLKGTFNPVDKVQALLGSDFHQTHSSYDWVLEGKRQWRENGPRSAWSVWSDSLWRYSPTWQNMKKHAEASFKYNLFSTNPSDISSSGSSSD